MTAYDSTNRENLFEIMNKMETVEMVIILRKLTKKKSICTIVKTKIFYDKSLILKEVQDWVINLDIFSFVSLGKATKDEKQKSKGIIYIISYYRFQEIPIIQSLLEERWKQ